MADDLYVRGKQLGAGSFGSAFAVKNKKTHEVFAMKTIPVNFLNQKERTTAVNEVRVLRRLRHPYIIKYVDAYATETHLNIIMEFALNGDLYTKIKNQRQTGYYFTDNRVLDWLAQMCLALDYIHKDQKILHRDVKSQNVFISVRNHVKLGDFGVSTCLDTTCQLANTCLGTPYYMSPELARNVPYNFKSDCWAMGCILYEMLTLKHAFSGNNISAVLFKIIMGQRPTIPSFIEPPIKKLVNGLLASDPEKRMSMEDVLCSNVMLEHVSKYARGARQVIVDRLNLFVPTKRNDVSVNQALDSESLPPSPRSRSPKKSSSVEDQHNAVAGEAAAAMKNENVRLQAVCPSPQLDKKQPPLPPSQIPAHQRTKRREELIPEGEQTKEEETKPSTHLSMDESVQQSRREAEDAIAKFRLGNMTLHISTCATETAYSRIESLRAFLEHRLGDELMIKAYRMVEAIALEEDSSNTFDDLRELLGPIFEVYMHLLIQLVQSEFLQRTDARN